MNKKENKFTEIARYFSGELSSDERLELENKLKANSEGADQLGLSKKVWEETYNPDQQEKLTISEKTFQKIHPEIKPRRFSKVLRYAAVFAALISISASLVWFLSNKKPETLLVEAKAGEVKNIILEDGTVVWLNSKSTLTYPVPFSRKERKVYLEGEAYFDVKSDEHHPFVVDTKDIIINVVGTKFNVSSYDNDPFSHTYLEEGKVIVDNKLTGGSHKIIPNQVMMLHKQTKNVSVFVSKLCNHASWRNGEQSFYNEYFFSIARKLERKFGVEIILENNKIGRLKFSADFENETIDEILDVFNAASTMEIVVEENKYYISEKKRV